jgi:hypothetical protein
MGHISGTWELLLCEYLIKKYDYFDETDDMKKIYIIFW